ncbi:hypothetical protein [Collinsella ihumii]|uniref:Tetraspanin family protein n=1 Tax=Collinsella ihumii TaxID=1720204 RepID=A0ABT7XH29_9ACTN|nr:hypothetical protein [Collinsella ihumii]MDN0064715.1 hypothetical protein [Collinsella ihumii]
MPDDIRSNDVERWLHVSMLAVKIVSFALICASMLYLAVAGANYAVLGAIFFDAEHQATVSVIGFSLVLFALTLASGILGIWAAGRRDNMSMLIFSGVSLVSVIVMIAGVSTSYFSDYDSAFSDVIVTALCATFAVFAALAAVAGVAWTVLQRKAPTMYGEAEGGADAEFEEGLVEEPEPEDAAQFAGDLEGDEPALLEDADLEAEAEDEGEAETEDLEDEADKTEVVTIPATWAAPSGKTEDLIQAALRARGELVPEAAEPAADDEDDDAAGLTKVPLDFMAFEDHAAPASAPAPASVPVRPAPAPAVAPVPEPVEEPEPPRPAGRRYASGAVPVPKVARTARHLTIPEGVAPAPVPQAKQPASAPRSLDETYAGEIEWVDFGAQSRVVDDIDDDDSVGGFLGKHFGRKR